MNLSGLVVGVILLTGLFVLTLPIDSFAVSEKGAEKGKATGCEESNPGKAKNNPHCSSSCDVNDPIADCDNDGIQNSSDFCPENEHGPLGQSENDWDGDGFPNSEDAYDCDPSKF